MEFLGLTSNIHRLLAMDTTRSFGLQHSWWECQYENTCIAILRLYLIISKTYLTLTRSDLSLSAKACIHMFQTSAFFSYYWYKHCWQPHILKCLLRQDSNPRFQSAKAFSLQGLNIHHAYHMLRGSLRGMIWSETETKRLTSLKYFRFKFHPK